MKRKANRIEEAVLGILTSCSYATRGISFAFRSQRNLRIHFFAALFVVVAGRLLQFEPWEMAVLVVTVTLVITAELFNSALEFFLNLMEARNHPTVRAVKDVAAGATLMAVIGSVVIGLLLFGSRLLSFMGVI